MKLPLSLRPCALLLVLLMPVAALADQPWETVVRDRERLVEIDRSSVIQSEGGTKVAWGRIVLTPERAAVEGYAWVKALNRYDCYNRAFYTVKRVYMDERNIVIREDGRGDETPILAARNSVDERMWQEVCKPPSVSELKKVATEVAAIAKTAGDDAKATPMVPLSHSATAGADAPNRERDRLSHKLNGKARKASAPTAASPAPVEKPVLVAKASVEHEKPSLRPAALVPASRPASAHDAALAARLLADFSRPDWSYEGETGPDRWGRMRPEWALCSEGKRQSPIDLRNGVAVDLDPPRFDYRETRFRIADTGRTLRVYVGPGMSVELRGERYELEFFEFYRPSAERVGGQASDMVVHLHHRSADGRTAIVGVLLEAGDKPHPLVQMLWNNMPLERRSEYAPAATIDVASLLPPSSGHYLFMGSDVTPPCAEGVLWAVMKEPQHISADQLEVFMRLYPRNGRPIQPANGRLVLESR
ncbi:MAG TPA: carbonic anhydrase family protein [Aromatoleum sp.]|uniref:carbonic anhydrase n=1 Tax=Aromatoleum sp. TaxID=2307007 RepID=UPI002B45AD3C|nr:carbonic anhydrase family protein [Aromatoleum sp.]HJV25026.1 carbonic anhydrase family protein [Aromatoleum sp.]